MKILAHSVPILKSGLSPMQENLLKSPKFLRIVSAPTGSGKSYAFVRASIENDQRILFIVPTKRLLQNLLEDACEQAEEHLKNEGWSENRIKLWVSGSFIEWSGNQDADEEIREIVSERVEQLQNPNIKIIFAIPEVVVNMISGIRVKGGTTINPFSYARKFDHIVFDEFHTISDRSFGLACLLALVAVNQRHGKVSLLSATPVNVTNVFHDVGVQKNEIEVIHEEIVNGLPTDNRPIHGEVEIIIEDHKTLTDTLNKYIEESLESISNGSTVILIYDSLQRLKKQERQLRDLLNKRDIPDNQILTINSIDDSTRKHGSSRRRHTYHDPRNYNVLICTSSVEVGVTFKSNLMIMEPGHNKSSFIQRVGRVCRGRNSGKVIVSCPSNRRNRSLWVKQIVALVEQNEVLEVQTFTAKFISDLRRQVEPDTTPHVNNSSIQYYRKVSWRGVFWAALFIEAVLLTKMKVQKEAWKRLKNLQSKKMRLIAEKINQIRQVEIVNDNIYSKHQPHKEWLNALFNSALSYRDIGSTLTIIDPDGSERIARESFIRRATNILSSHILHEEDGRMIVRLRSRTLDQEIQDFSGKNQEHRLRLFVRSPIGGRGYSISIHEYTRQSESTNIRLVEEWKNSFGELMGQSEKSSKSPQEEVMKAATKLVELLGKPPLEEDHEDSIESAIFA